jgi:hypothetical protein
MADQGEPAPKPKLKGKPRRPRPCQVAGCPYVDRHGHLSRHYLTQHDMDTPPGTAVRLFRCDSCDKRWLNLETRPQHYLKKHAGVEVPQTFVVRDHHISEEEDDNGETEEDDYDAEEEEDDAEEEEADTVVRGNNTLKGADTEDVSKNEPITEEECLQLSSKMTLVRKTVMEDMQEYVRTMPECSYKTRKTIAGEYLYAMRHDLKRLMPLVVQTAAEHEVFLGANKMVTDSVVLMTSEQANHLLRLGPPRLPFVISPKHNPGQRLLDPDVFERFLLHKHEIEYHKSEHDITKVTTTYREPPAVALAYLNNPANPPSNFLNLAGHVEAEEPDFIVGIPEYNFVRSVRELDSAGKQVRERTCDFTSTSKFALYAPPWAVSPAHRDGAGSISRAKAEKDASKLWLMWPGLTEEDIEEWVGDGTSDDRRDWSPKQRPIAVLLEEGWTLIMPMGCVHSVLTLKKSLVTGSKMWHTEAMVDVAKHVLSDLRRENATNEDIAYECVEKLKVAAAEWSRTLSEGNGYWKFGTKEELKEFQRLLKVCHPQATTPYEDANS